MSFTSIIDSDRAGALIPAEASTQVIAAALQASAALRLCRRIPMSTLTYEQAILSETVDAFWIRNGQLKKSTAAIWDNVVLRAEELAAVVVADNNTLADAQIDIWNALTPEFGQAIARKLDAAVLGGIDRPDSWPPSILEGARAAGQVVQTGSGVEAGGIYGDLAALLDALEQAGVDATGYAARRNLRGMLRRQRSTTGEMLGEANLTDAWGLEFQFAPANTIPAPALVLAGAWELAAIGVRQDMRLERFDTGVITDEDGTIVANLLQEDRSALRLTFRAGYATANPVRSVEGSDPARSFPFAVLEAGPGVPANGAGDGGGDGDQEPEEAAARASTARTAAKK
jgi:HK97 family phage major capsid protein